MNEKRLVVALFGVAVAAVAGYMAYRYIAAITIAVFVYYSTRPLYRFLGKMYLPYPQVSFGRLYVPKLSLGKQRFLPRRVRATLVILFLGVPLVTLLGYTAILLVGEARAFAQEYSVLESLAQNVELFEGLDDIPDLSIEGLAQAYQNGRFDEIINFITNNGSAIVGFISGFFLNLLIIVVVTYYLLIDGWKARRWLLRFDDDAVVRDYLEAADEELEAVLFGNLLNVIAIAILAIVVYTGYNVVVPAPAEVPYPALAGALTGIASLVPVVGMKIVYFPLAGFVGFSAVLNSETTLLVYVAAFLAVAVVVVDTVPDIVLRPYLSGEDTHVGLLMLAYILGPSVFGFYGLFFAPIVLVLGLTFAQTVVPTLLGAEDEPDVSSPELLPRKQQTLDDF
jgi:predicted PurR-regulated permease PerM